MKANVHPDCRSDRTSPLDLAQTIRTAAVRRRIRRVFPTPGQVS
jgi:hypothetical protein